MLAGNQNNRPSVCCNHETARQTQTKCLTFDLNLKHRLARSLPFITVLLEVTGDEEGLAGLSTGR